MKKIIILLLMTLAIILTFCSCKGDGNDNNDDIDNATYSKGLEFELSEDGKSYIVMSLGTNEGPNLVIPSYYEGKPVSTINDYAFYGHHWLTSVVIPDTVVSIGDFAFYHCNNLKTISIGKGVEKIGNYAILGDEYMKISISPENKHYKLIDGHLCSKDGKELIVYTLNEGENTIVIPNSIEKIDGDSFPILLMSRNIMDNFTYNEYNGSYYIGSKANPYLILYIPNYNVTEFEFHPDTKIIYSLGNITVPTLTIPEQINYICQTPSYDLNGVLKIDANNQFYKTIDGNLYTKDGKILISIFNFEDYFVVPDGVEKIGDYAFCNYIVADGQDDYVTVVMPDSVKEIGAFAFHQNQAIKSVIFSNNLEKIGTNAFAMCGNLMSVDIPDSVKIIAPYGFKYCSLTSVKLSNSLKRIDHYTFEGCNSLTSIEIPNSVKYIGTFALACKSLQSIEIPSSVEFIGGYAFSGCSMETLVIPDTVKVLHSMALCNCKAKNIVIGNSVTNLSGLNDNDALESIVIGDSVKEIEAYAFRNCKSLKTVVIGKGVEKIDNRAFLGCESLESISIPDSVKVIGEEAFAFCYNLVSIELGKNVESIGLGAFWNCTSLEKIVIPQSVKTMGEYAFMGCKSLTIYCEAPQKSDGWNEDWNPSNRKVEWNYTQN
jgi:hypothetical protein